MQVMVCQCTKFVAETSRNISNHRKYYIEQKDLTRENFLNFDNFKFYSFCVKIEGDISHLRIYMLIIWRKQNVNEMWM